MTIKTRLETMFGRRTLIGAALGVGALTLAACGGGTPAEVNEPSPAAEAAPIVIPMEGLEKTDLKFGFIKLTDMAPLAIAYEKGYFEEEGLFVTL
ncbi:MAG: ABC transporter substrate-binding protein, partial [Pseudomonadota bacterium]